MHQINEKIYREELKKKIEKKLYDRWWKWYSQQIGIIAEKISNEHDMK